MSLGALPSTTASAVTSAQPTVVDAKELINNTPLTVKDAEAILLLARVLEAGAAKCTMPPEALREIAFARLIALEKNNQTDSTTLFLLSECHRLGHGTKKDPTKAAEYLSRCEATENGCLAIALNRIKYYKSEINILRAAQDLQTEDEKLWAITDAIDGNTVSLKYWREEQIKILIDMAAHTVDDAKRTEALSQVKDAFKARSGLTSTVSRRLADGRFITPSVVHKSEWSLNSSCGQRFSLGKDQHISRFAALREEGAVAVQITSKTIDNRARSTITLWSPNAGSVVPLTEQHPITSASASPSHDSMLGLSRNHLAIVVDPSSSKPIELWRYEIGAANSISRVLTSPNIPFGGIQTMARLSDDFLLAAGYGTCVIWDTKTNTLSEAFSGREPFIVLSDGGIMSALDLRSDDYQVTYYLKQFIKSLLQSTPLSQAMAIIDSVVEYCAELFTLTSAEFAAQSAAAVALARTGSSSIYRGVSAGVDTNTPVSTATTLASPPPATPAQPQVPKLNPLN